MVIVPVATVVLLLSSVLQKRMIRSCHHSATLEHPRMTACHLGLGQGLLTEEVAASSLRKRSVMKTIFSSRVICGVVGWVDGVASTDTSCGLILLEESSVLASWASSG